MAALESANAEVVSTLERRVSTGVDDGRIPTLDGWRGIAILLVLITHAQAGLLGYALFPWMDVGQHGVTIFFVLSGYLITSRLRGESRINLHRFYLRRFFRLMPVAWCYLAAVFLLRVVTHLDIIGKDVWYCLFFVRNTLPENSSNTLTGHFWSLSLEEQFYVVWPLALVLLGRARALPAAASGVVLCAILRLWHARYFDQPAMGPHSEIQMDAILAGCTLALLLEKKAIREWFARRALAVFFPALPLFVWHLYRYQNTPPVSESILIAAMIAATSLAPDSRIGKLLERPHLKSLGLLSYSLYVWQELFLVPHWGALTYVMIALLPLAAIGSYALIERPFIRMGRRLEARFSGGGQANHVSPQMAAQTSM
jgi:peptidoglycan/LPS O-acetylase OafA/YrhL